MRKIRILAIMLVLILLAFAAGSLAACQTAATTTVATTTVATTTVATTDATTPQTSVSETTDTYTVINATLYRDGLKIIGHFYVPTGVEGPMPIVIFAHGFNGRYKVGDLYAPSLAEQGVACFGFDFIGGAGNTESDGDMTEMSVMTEVADLNTVIDFVKSFDFVDPDRLFLTGFSQGGLVSALVAAERPAEVKGLVLFYPALSIPDDMRALFPDLNAIGDTVQVLGNATVGKIYVMDVYNLDVFAEIGKYPGDVLIMHGTKDATVAIANSEHAVEVYPSAVLVPFVDAPHGFFTDEYKNKSITLLDEFIAAHIG